MSKIILTKQFFYTFWLMAIRENKAVLFLSVDTTIQWNTYLKILKLFCNLVCGVFTLTFSVGVGVSLEV